VRRRTSGAWRRWFGVIALVVVAGFFSLLNSSERVTLSLGFTVLYQLSLVGLIFGAFLLGMITMFFFGLSYDRRVRSALRQEFVPPRASSDPHAFHPPPDPTA